MIASPPDQRLERAVTVGGWRVASAFRHVALGSPGTRVRPAAQPHRWDPRDAHAGAPEIHRHARSCHVCRRRAVCERRGVLSFVAGLGSWLLGGGLGWAIAALLIGAVVPFTLIGIMPTNRALLAQGRDLGTAETRSLLEHWAKLHAVRTVLSLAATILYVCLALGS
jgi:hypothetical protein